MTYINLHDIAEKLYVYHPKLLISDESKTLIATAKLLTEDTLTYEPDILYVGEVSVLARVLTIPQLKNILCISAHEHETMFNDRSNINVIILEKGINLLALFNEIQDIFTAHLRYSQKMDIMTDAMLKGKGLQCIVELASELLNCPMNLGDLGARLIAHHNLHLLDSPEFHRLLTNGYIPFDDFNKKDFKIHIENTNINPEPAYTKNIYGSQYNALVGKIMAGNTNIAYLMATELQHAFSAGDMKFFKFVCEIISEEMQKRKSYTNYRGINYENLILDILEETINREQLLSDRLKFSDLNLRENLYVIVINTSEFNSPHFKLSVLMSYVESILYGSNALFYKDHIVMLISRDKKALLTSQDFEPLISYLGQYRLYGGISKSFNNISDLKHNYLQAFKTVELGMRHDKDRTFFTFDSYAIYHIIDNCSKKENPEEFCHPAIYQLMSFDEKKNTRYTQTLCAFLICDRSNIETSKLLNIHKGTLQYRMDRIVELTGIQLHNPNTVHHLYLTYKILKYSKKLDDQSLEKLLEFL